MVRGLGGVNVVRGERERGSGPTGLLLVLWSSRPPIRVRHDHGVTRSRGAAPQLISIHGISQAGLPHAAPEGAAQTRPQWLYRQLRRYSRGALRA